jgi:hypothetical protein
MIGGVYKDKLEGTPAMIVIESNPGSPGIVPQEDLIKRNYPNLYTWKSPGKISGTWTTQVGWKTTPSTRPLLTEAGVKGIRDKQLLINSPFFVDEMLTYVDTGVGKGKRHFEHAPGYHDDRIMALFIAYYIAHENDTLAMAEERRRRQIQLTSPKDPSKVIQFSASFDTYEDLLSRWEDAYTS